MNDKMVFVLTLSLVLLVSLVGPGNTFAQNNTDSGTNMTNSTGSNMTNNNPTGSNPPGMSQGQSGPNPTGSNIPCVAGNPCM
jgi:hypothetical protein